MAAANDMREAHDIELLRTAILLNGIQRTALTTLTRKALKETGVPILESTLGRRVAYGEAIAMGQGVTTYEPGSVAALELRNLTGEIATILGFEEVSYVEAG